ncbi:Aste57867_21128 [Aphanomyces stellatus]|uniref:Aste57867_21128 protein n=1 Tax=Aphanomyces stellatus TaxID=120398 RepID=A0A485LHB4_9STRA|nr:hypothetical protein As57867_021060 [Aphanomyces stellatus]VFT97802.1 Aste57867_21128 [Aphanomyces stellatus]
MDEEGIPVTLFQAVWASALTLLGGIVIGFITERFRTNSSLKFVFFTLPVGWMTVVNEMTNLPMVPVVVLSIGGHFLGASFVAVGLTGGIATGKSTVSAVAKRLNAVIIDADIVARQVVEPGKPAYNKIVDLFGKDVLNEDKTINRAMLGGIIFNSPEKRQALNSCTHRYILLEMFWQLVYQRLVKHRRFVIFDAPLLFETKLLQYFCGPIIVVTCSEEEELKRLMARDGLTEEKAMARIKSQMSLADKVKLADIVVDNNGTKDALEKLAEETLVKVAEIIDAKAELKKVATGAAAK